LSNPINPLQVPPFLSAYYEVCLLAKRPTLVYMLPPAVVPASGLKLVSKDHRGIRSRIFKRLSGPGIDTKESIRKAYVAWQAGTTNRVIEPEFENV
jgi:hypothetical protein